MYASNSHSYTHLVLALGIVREPTVWVFITSAYPGTHDIGLPTDRGSNAQDQEVERLSPTGGELPVSASPTTPPGGGAGVRQHDQAHGWAGTIKTSNSGYII